MKLRWALGLFVAIVLSGCAPKHPAMICMFGYIDDQAVLGCVDARTVPGIEGLKPYVPALPMPEPTRPGMIPWSEKHGTHTKGEL